MQHAVSDQALCEGAALHTNHQGDDEAGSGDLSNLLAHGRNLQDLEARSRLWLVSVQHENRAQPSAAAPSLQPHGGRGRAGSAGPSAWRAAAYARSEWAGQSVPCLRRACHGLRDRGTGSSAKLQASGPIRHRTTPAGPRTEARARRTDA